MRCMSLVLETTSLAITKSYQGIHPTMLSHLVLTMSRLMNLLPTEAGTFWLRAELPGCDNLNLHPLVCKFHLRFCHAWPTAPSSPDRWDSTCSLGHPPASFFSNRPDPLEAYHFMHLHQDEIWVSIPVSAWALVWVGFGSGFGSGPRHLPASRDGTLDPSLCWPFSCDLAVKIRCHKAELFRNDLSCHRF